MVRSVSVVVYVFLAAVAASGQTAGYPYIVKNLAGNLPPGDGGQAAAALLNSPDSIVQDSAGNIYILETKFDGIRKITPAGTISTLTTFNFDAFDLALGPDGNFYIGSTARVYRVTPSGSVTAVAGTGTSGSTGDGGPALSARVGAVFAVTVDSTGNIYITESFRVRKITPDGKIQTIAGTGQNGFSGDNGPATAAQLSTVYDLAIGADGTLYITDSGNSRVRKVTPEGIIITIAGSGDYDIPKSGPATASPIGFPYGVAVDSSGNVYVTDYDFWEVLKISPSGGLSLLAGNPALPFSVEDGPTATGTFVWGPKSLNTDAQGNVLFTDRTHRVRQITADNRMRTIAGRIHFGGDGGPATSAILNEPQDVAVDSAGNVLIADSQNFRIRRVSSGTISTYAGTGIPGYPAEGSKIASVIPYVSAMAQDAQGRLYLAGASKVIRIETDGTFTTIAGNGNSGYSGDGSLATQASVGGISGLTVDRDGNVYISVFVIGFVGNRLVAVSMIRKVSAIDGRISAFAGSFPQSGYSGDGGLATLALLDFSFGGALASDANGNLYIADTGNNVVRMISTTGVISTIAGNRTLGHPADGQQARSAPLTPLSSIAVDKDGNLYLASQLGRIYRISGGIIRTVSGGGSVEPIDGAPAVNVAFLANGIKVDTNGDLYAADAFNGSVRKLILNSPSALTMVDGNNQSAQTGKNLAKPLKVLVNGRAGVGVSGATVNFAVVSGTARLSAASTQADAAGQAEITVTLGDAAGDVVISASIAGSALPAVRFTAKATATVPGCTVDTPSITSVKSAEGYGGFSNFASGSWLEIKGTNLAPNTRQWGGADFNGNNAPTSLDGVTVSINRINGYVLYISPAQINVQAPADATLGNVPITVTHCGGTSAPVSLAKVARAPGMLAPPAFNVGGKQYLVAVYPDGYTYVGNPDLIPGANFRPAKPGDSLTAYGTGFGDVTPAQTPGVVAEAGSLPEVTIAFNDTPASVSYAGLAPGSVGLYQFNFAVPDVPDGDYQVQVTVDGRRVQQMLYLTVRR